MVCYAKVPQLFFGIHSTSLACQNYIKRRYNTCNLFSGTEQHWCFFLFCLRHASFCSTCSGFADSGVITVCLGLFLLFSVSCCFWPRWCIRLRQVSRFWLPIFVSFLTCPSDDVWIRAYITHTLDIFCFCLCLARDWRKILANTSIFQNLICVDLWSLDSKPQPKQRLNKNRVIGVSGASWDHEHGFKHLHLVGFVMVCACPGNDSG